SLATTGYSVAIRAVVAPLSTATMSCTTTLSVGFSATVMPTGRGLGCGKRSGLVSSRCGSSTNSGPSGELTGSAIGLVGSAGANLPAPAALVSSVSAPASRASPASAAACSTAAAGSAIAAGSPAAASAAAAASDTEAASAIAAASAARAASAS